MREEAHAIGFALGVGLAIVCFIAVKSIELLVRVLAKYPHCKALWAALAVFGLATLLTPLYPTLLPLWALSFLALLATAKTAEVYYDQLLQTPVTKEELLDNVLHKPWWQLNPEPAAAAA